MKRVIIKAPANSFRGAKMQIEAGAGELYCGFDTDYFGEITFSGRNKESCFDKNPTLMSYEDFAKTVKYAHERGVLVELVANNPISTDSNFKQNNNYRDQYLKYVQMGLEAGVDRIIVGDIGNIIFLREAGIKAKITASTFIGALNNYTVDFLEEIGIEKIVLPHNFTLEEIKAFTEHTNIKVEIFGHFGCSFLEGACGLLHVNNENLTTGIPCRAMFKINNGTEEINILDVNEDCSICQMDKVMEIGVESIKTIGRDLTPEFMSGITAAYSMAIDLFLEGLKKDEVLSTIKEEIDFTQWEKTFCCQDRCKYLKNEYYI